MANSIYIQLPKMRSTVIDNITNILKRKIIEKSGEGLSIVVANPVSNPAAHTVLHSNSNFPGNTSVIIELGLDPSLGEEGFVIMNVEESVGLESTARGVRINGHNERGLLYGVGKLLRDAHYADGHFELGSWRGTSTPEKKVRGIYCAVHFYNYYHCAPLEEVIAYVEDIALWGFNTIAVWYDMHHFTSIKDPEAVEMIERLKHILSAAKDIGLMTSLIVLGNEAYANSPVELRAEWTEGNGYRSGGLGSHYHVELCPSKPGARELMLRWKQEVFEAFSDIGIDYVCMFPYDQGGCTCADCKPWGGNGFLKVASDGAELARKCLPDVKVILSAWLFDYFTSGEWEKLSELLERDRSAFDYVMWDYNTTCDTGTDFIVDRYLTTNGVPGGLPLIGFPEISMFATQPFGGWGANPQPGYIQSIWDQAGAIFAGGFPYSEGIYEDMNKIICSQLYWDSDMTAEEAIRAYISYEYSATMVDEIARAVNLMQATYIRTITTWGEAARFVIQSTDGIDETYEILSKVDQNLDLKVRQSWRWRVLYLRALIDYELLHHHFSVSDRCEEALVELERMYYAEHAASAVAPATKRALKSYKIQ